MIIHPPSIKIERNVWKRGEAFETVIRDLDPRSAYSIRFAFKQHDEIIYGQLKTVFQCKVTALDGSMVDFELWVSHMFNNNRQRPALGEAYKMGMDAIRVGKKKLVDAKAAHRVKVNFPPIPFSDHEVKRKLIAALNREFPPTTK